MKYVNTVCATVIAVAALVCGVVLTLNGHEAAVLFTIPVSVVSFIAGVTVPRNPAPAIVEPPPGDLA